MKKYYIILCICFTYLYCFSQNADESRRTHRAIVKQTLQDSSISKMGKLNNTGNQTDSQNNLPSGNNSRLNRRSSHISSVKPDSSIINVQTTKTNTSDSGKQNNEIRDRRNNKKQLLLEEEKPKK
ncbi:MAG: hypothetical protein HY738_23185 [Bacteroidia bacterium]|nr:hypothetical protein [Bacteroidia bacterium]